MPLSEITGQDIAVRSITSFLRDGRIPHALLFYGPAGCGKRTTAVAFAQAANCTDTRPEEDACGQCRACRRIAKGIDLDVIIYEPSRLGYNKDKAKEIRDEAFITPNAAKHKFLILCDSSNIYPEAANLMLKIFEEPPAFTTFIFTTQNIDRILPTIRSRALPVPFKPLSLEEAMQVAAGRLDAQMVRFLHPLAKGNLGLMFKLAEDEVMRTAFDDLEKIVLHRLENKKIVAPGLVAAELVALASRIKLASEDDTPSIAERKSVIFLLEAMLIFLDRRFNDAALNANNTSGAETNKELKKNSALIESVLSTIKAVKGGGHTILSLETLAIEYRRTAGL